MKLIGLTGGIASGKSLVSNLFKDASFSIIDADEITKAVTKPGEKVYDDIVKEFGSEFVKDDKNLDKKKLAKLIFKNSTSKTKLEGLTHPEIRKKISEKILEHKKKKTKILILDAPLLIERGLYKQMDKVVVVYVDTDTQKERVIKRDGISGEEAILKIKAQMPLDEKRDYADYLIDNSGTPEITKEQVFKLIKRIKKL